MNFFLHSHNFQDAHWGDIFYVFDKPVAWIYLWFKLMCCDSGNKIHFSMFKMQIFYLVKKWWYQSIMQFLVPKQRNFFSAAVKSNFNIPGIGKLCMWVCYLLKIIKFTNCCTWSFLYIFNNNLCVRFLKQGMYVFRFMFYIFHPIFQILL